MGYANRGIRKSGNESKVILKKDRHKMSRNRLYLEILTKSGLDLEDAVEHCFARVIKCAPSVRIWKKGQLVIIDVFDYPKKTFNGKEYIEVMESDVMGVITPRQLKYRNIMEKL